MCMYGSYRRKNGADRLPEETMQIWKEDMGLQIQIAQ